MAYLTNTTPPRLTLQAISEQTAREWHMEGTDPVATVKVNGYITNGGAYGMKVNDTLVYTDTNLNIVSRLRVASVSSTYPGAVDLGEPTTMAAATNSD